MTTSSASAAWGERYLEEIRQQEIEGLLEIKDEIHRTLVDNANLQVLQALTDDQLLDRIQATAVQVIEDKRLTLSSKVHEQLQSQVMAELRGYGPLQPLLDDPTISEIMVNGPHHVYIERSGKLHKTDVVFTDSTHVRRIIEKIIAPLGRWIDESSPMVDARLPDGSRVNAIIPPLAINGATVTIRKFSKEPITPQGLVDFGTLTEEMAQLLQACVEARLNIIVSGGTGSGKTTTLNVLSSFIPAGERIITIEDAAELQLNQEHIVTLESRPPNLEGTGEITIRQLVRNSLRMRPDRIIVGEVRGGEALDMLQAMNTGHDGSLTTAHTNSPRDTLSRLETMALMAGTELPSRAIREQIVGALNLIVHQSRFRDGTRKITHITEVQGMEKDTIILQDIYRYEQHGIDEQGNVIGEHIYTQLRPKFADNLLSQGVELPPNLSGAWKL